MNEINEQTIIDFYQYFYRKKHKTEKYTYKPSDRARKMINNFIKKLDELYSLKVIGKSFLWNYFVYQFNYWRSAELVSFYGKFKIEYVIGNKALKRFKEDKYDNLWVTQGSEIISDYNLRKSDLVKEERVEYKSNYEITLKKKHHNKPKGFYLCIETTTLYNPQHLCCITCDFKHDCKKILKDRFFNLYQKRGLG